MALVSDETIFENIMIMLQIGDQISHLMIKRLDIVHNFTVRTKHFSNNFEIVFFVILSRILKQVLNMQYDFRFLLFIFKLYNIRYRSVQ